MKTIFLEDIVRAKHLLSITYRYDDYRFEVGLWYDNVDLVELEQKYSKEYLDSIYFHIAAFELNKLISLKPDYVDFGKYSRYCTPTFFYIWDQIQDKVWAQWRYENDLPDYDGPSVANPDIFAKLPPKVTLGPADTEILSFCGGGKDSLVSARLLEKLDIPYASFVYSNSIYGQAQKQHEIVNQLLEQLAPQKIHRQYVYDSFIDSPILKLDDSFKYKGITAAETPSSIFASLPIVLAYNYKHIALGHEYSANVGNLIWDKTGEEINHQWGKSFKAEQLLNLYIQAHLIDNFSYFSILQPIYDVVIFNLLREDKALLPFAHSCNIEKPWCMKCPKCAYVWLNYMAYLPVALVNEVFNHTNLLDIPENQLWYKQMLGLGTHTPFECIGQVEESRLALHICKQKGLEGEAMQYYAEIKDVDFEKIARAFVRINTQATGYPKEIEKKLIEKLNAVSEDSLKYLKKHI